jgi:regulator of nucleoside diphosphate kinase
MNTPTMTNNSTIHLCREDYGRLRPLAAALPKSKTADGLPTLRTELERATVVPRELLPPGVVTVNSRVRFEDLASGDVAEYVITWPERADGGRERISVLAPIGTALIGYREGDEVSWPTPGGTRRLRVLQVEPVDESSLFDPKEEALARLLYGAA